jgi:hypothetical protein
VSPPESHDPSSAMPDALARPVHSQLWTRLSEGLFPLLFFPLATLALYWAAMEDVPRGDHVILWEIFRGLDWRWSEINEILFVSFLDKPRFQPLMFFLHFLQAKLFGQTFWLYHLVNVVLHGLNAFLLFRIARALDQDWLPAFAVALLFLTAFTHLDLVAWAFHYYILLQATLALFSVYLLIRRDRVSWLLVSAYAVALVQIYLYEPGIVLPALLFAIDVGRRFRRPGWMLRLSASFLLACGATAIYLATYLTFFASMEAGLGAEDPRALIDAPSLLRAFASPIPLILDSAILHNLFSAPKFIVDELFFLAPPRIDRFAFADSITNTLVVGCSGLVALAFLAVLLRPGGDETEEPPGGEPPEDKLPEEILPEDKLGVRETAREAVGERRPRIYAAATLASGIVGFGFVFYRLPWAAGPSIFEALFVIWLPVALLAAVAVRSPARAATFAQRIASRWPGRMDPLYLGLALLLALVLLFLAPRGVVAGLADDGARLLLGPWDFAAILLALALILMGERPRGRRLAWLLFVLAAVIAYSGIIGLGRPVVYLISQSRYAYLPALALAILALIIFAPVLARRPEGERRWLNLLSLRKHAILAGLILFMSLNAVKVLDGLDRTMAYRAETNRIVYETRRFLDDRVQSGDSLFVARSSYPNHERLAWGSGILPRILFAGDERVTQNLQTATHVLGDEGRAMPVPGALLDAGADSFVLRFGFIAVVRQAGAATLEIFTPEGGCAAAGRYLDFAFDESQPALEDDQLGFGRLVFGRCAGGAKTALFESDPVMVEFNRLNLFEFGRAKDDYYLIHNAVLAKTAPALDPIDLNEMNFELGEAYETRVKVYLTHTFIGVGFAPRDIEDAEIGDRFADPPYHPFGFRTYARTLI